MNLDVTWTESQAERARLQAAHDEGADVRAEVEALLRQLRSLVLEPSPGGDLPRHADLVTPEIERAIRVGPIPLPEDAPRELVELVQKFEERWLTPKIVDDLAKQLDDFVARSRRAVADLGAVQAEVSSASNLRDLLSAYVAALDALARMPTDATRS